MTNPPLRIAQVAPLWTDIPPATYGGIEVVVHLLTSELVRRGHDVTLFAAGGSRTDARLHPVCEQNVLALMQENGAALYEYYANAAVAEALREPDRFDVVHVHAGMSLVPFSAVAETPIAFTMHTYFSADDEWVLARYPESVTVGISRYQVQKLAQARGREIPVVYNGIDFDGFEPCYEPGQYLVFLGRLSYDKNPLDAIRIAQRVGLPVILAGRSQSAKEEKYFEENVRGLIDGERVRWIGPVDHAQKTDLLRHAAALLFPVQWAEPFGLVMVEAMACGTPVVAHALGSVAEVVDQGVTGFHADSIDAMADLVPRALALDRRTVRQQAESRFGYQAMTDRYCAFYQSLLQ